jgi:hypothetical protein
VPSGEAALQFCGATVATQGTKRNVPGGQIKPSLYSIGDMYILNFVLLF